MPEMPKTFRPSHLPSRGEQRQEADQRRGSASDRGYNHRWSKARDTHLRNHPICIGCEAVGIVKAASVVDHVDPHHGDPEKFWDTSLWQSCCKWHHDSVKKQLEVMYAQGRLQLPDLWLNSEAAKALTASMQGL